MDIEVIVGPEERKHKEPRRLALLSGGVGGARMARGLAAVHDEVTIIINVGDDDTIYGVHISPDIDTVCYTLAGIEGDRGWGIRGDSFEVMKHLRELGFDTTFQIGDRDLATSLARTQALRSGEPLSGFTGDAARHLGIDVGVLPVTDDPVRTMVQIEGGEVLAFQEYFVHRGHRDRVEGLEFRGSDTALPAPGVLEAIADADTVIIAPSNPMLSIWPILAVPGVRDAVAGRAVVAVSPLIGGEAVKGPAADLLVSFGYGADSAGVVAAYEGLVDTLVVDAIDASDVVPGVEVRAADTMIAEPEAAARLAAQL